MKKWLFGIAFLCSALVAFADEKTLTVKDRLIKGQAGDYVVTEQGKHIALLLIRSLSPQSIILEEIIAPSYEISHHHQWKEWVQKRAPGHTSWTAYEIDLSTACLKEVYSYTKRGWLYADEQEYFLAKLLSLPLLPTPLAERRRIGPAPQDVKDDHRALWFPPVVIEGKREDHPAIEALKTRWGKDQSELSECAVEVYFHEQPQFPFPYWIEIKGDHYTFKTRAIDSGTNLVSPMPLLPYRAPEFLGSAQKTEKGIKLKLRTPAYYRQFRLYAIDLSSLAKETLLIPHTLLPLQKGELCLEISSQTLSSLLKPGHRYRWMAVPEGKRDIVSESEEIFSWN